MSINKINLNTSSPFASVPNEVAQSEKLSAEAKGTIVFLQSLPSGWQIHPDWVQKRMGFGRDKWRRIASELIKFGCLQLVKDPVAQGSYYNFSLYNYRYDFSPQNIPETQTVSDISRPPEKPTVGKTDSRKTRPYIKKHSKKETLLNKTTNKDVVVSEIDCFGRRAKMDELIKLGLTQAVVDRILNKFSITRIAEVIEMYHQAKADKPGWIVTALKEEWMPDYKKMPQRGSNAILSADEQMKKIKEMSDREHVRRISEYEARNKKVG